MAPYDNLPYFRSWLEANIGHTSKSRNDMLILGDFIRYCLTDKQEGGIVNFHLKYRDQDWFVGLSIARNNIPVSSNEVVIELTDDALSSILAQCAFNEGSVLNERKRKGQADSDHKEA